VSPAPQRRGRPSRPELVVVLTVAAAAIAFVVVLTVGLLDEGVGTGDPRDPWRGVVRILSDPTTWRIVALSAALVGVVATLVALVTRRR
jgi:ABC-type Fe3+ transport system permease subunit